jgi:hypothetical protein
MDYQPQIEFQSARDKFFKDSKRMAPKLSQTTDMANDDINFGIKKLGLTRDEASVIYGMAVRDERSREQNKQQNVTTADIALMKPGIPHLENVPIDEEISIVNDVWEEMQAVSEGRTAEPSARYKFYMYLKGPKERTIASRDWFTRRQGMPADQAIRKFNQMSPRYRAAVLSALADPQEWAQGISAAAERDVSKSKQKDFLEGRTTPPANVIKFETPEPKEPAGELLNVQQLPGETAKPQANDETRRRNLDFILNGKL